MIDNPNAGIREAPYYRLLVINICTTQQNRALHKDIINCGYEKDGILYSIEIAKIAFFQKVDLYGEGNSDKLFLKSI